MRKTLDISPTKKPLPKGAWRPGQSGNPKGRPVSRKKQIEIANAWDSFRQSDALQWLHYALNFRLPKSLEPLFAEEGEMTAAEKKELRETLTRNFWAAMDWIRKTIPGKLGGSADLSDVPSIEQMLKQGQARKSGKIVDIELKREARS